MTNVNYSCNTHLFFETISTKLKIAILVRLKEKPASVTYLATVLKQERSKVSHALLSLAECNFVDAKKEGKNRIYSLNKDTVIPLMRLVDKHMRKYCKFCRKQE